GRGVGRSVGVRLSGQRFVGWHAPTLGTGGGLTKGLALRLGRGDQRGRCVRALVAALADEERGRAVQVHHLRVEAVVLDASRSEEHTSELQSLAYLVCR